LLLAACGAAAPAPGRECSAEQLRDALVDINLSLPRGVRGAEPVFAASPEACVRACCSGEKPPGDKKCNLAIFDIRRTSAHPNCYLFYCPSTEACPMKPATGFVSYKITRDTRALEDTTFKSEDFSSHEYSLPSDDGAFISHSQTTQQNGTATLQQSVFHQASQLLNDMAKQLDKSGVHPVFPESQRAEHPETLDSIPRQKVINLWSNTSSTVRIGNTSASFLTTQSSVPDPSSTTLSPLPTSTIRVESRTTSVLAAGGRPTAVTTTTATFLHTANARAKPGIPPATITATHVPLFSPTTSTSSSTTKQVTTNSRSATTPSGLRTPAILEPTVVSSNDTSHVTLLSFPGVTLSASDSSTAPQNDSQGYDTSNLDVPENVLRGKGVIQLGEKTSLVAALLFGVIFLLLVIALTGKKIHESLQKRHYTRLDYLINGIYADV
ncbi:MANS1 protein, partial [Piaya cayana]|nr:MANS1 protein [Piaya cayana]